jgi:NodT family efflux transporter outer membrane factor (OMF) lipoprotein
MPSAVDSATGNNSSLSLAAGFELDLWQKLKKESSAANFEAQASQEDIQTLYLSLTAQVADIYYLAVEQRAQLALLDSIIESNRGTLTLIEARYNEGQARALDVYQARENLVAVQARRPVSMANLAVTEHAIAVLLGRFPEKDIAGKLTVLPAVPTAYPSGLPADLLKNRPDIRAAFLRVEARDKRLGAALADRFPNFNLLADYGKSDSSLSSVFTGTFWDIIIKAALPVVDGGRRRAEVERNRAILEEELARYQQIVRRGFQEVDDALAKNATSEERVNLLAEQLANANESARLSLDNYMFGLEGYLPVLISQRLQLEVETQLLSAKRQLIADRISLIRALGGSWMVEYIVMKNEEQSIKN